MHSHINLFPKIGNEQTNQLPLNNRQISYQLQLQQPIQNQVITLQSPSFHVNGHAFINNNNTTSIRNHYLYNPQPATNNIYVLTTIQNPVINQPAPIQQIQPLQTLSLAPHPYPSVTSVSPTLFINDNQLQLLQTINNVYRHMPAMTQPIQPIQSIQTSSIPRAPIPIATTVMCNNTNNVHVIPETRVRKTFQQTTHIQMDNQMTKPDKKTTKLGKVKSKEKKFVCEICGKQYKYLCNLKSHHKIHTDDCYKCEYCGKKFGRKSNYKEHVRVHTGECPFKCTFCNKRFKQRHGWKDHLRVHTGEKPYECNICQRRFSVGHNLNVHKRIHSGEKPFKCGLCSKSFRQKSALDFHTKSAHKQ